MSEQVEALVRARHRLGYCRRQLELHSRYAPEDEKFVRIEGRLAAAVTRAELELEALEQKAARAAIGNAAA
jgi:hypothetical protein